MDKYPLHRTGATGYNGTGKGTRYERGKVYPLPRRKGKEGEGEMKDIEMVRNEIEQRENSIKEMEEKLRKNSFTLADFMVQFEQIQKMGNLTDLIGMIPGMSAQLKGQQIDESRLKKFKAMIQSMTPAERENPDLIKGSQKKRIATGSATTIQDVNMLLKQYEQTKLMMKNMNNGKMSKLMGMAGNKFKFR